MRTLIYSSLFVLLSACSGADYELSFENIPFSRLSEAPEEPVDSAVAFDDRMHKLCIDSGESFVTDKTAYKRGESIVATIQNNTEGTIYLYPKDAGFGWLFMPIDKEEMDHILVSKNPAISGQVYETNTNYFSLMLSCIHQDFVDPYGYAALELALEPRESVNFEIVPPNLTGTFRFIFGKHDHSGKGLDAWGMNRFIYSNSFTIE